jgi:Fe2+ or Zn2+ uptake regulation protein
MQPNELLPELFDKKILEIIKHLIDNPEQQFYLRELSRKTKVPVATTYRIVHKLSKLELVKEIRIKKFKLYQISQNKNVQFLASFLEEKRSAIAEFVEKASSVEGVMVIIRHGKETKDKANLLVIGRDVQQDKLQVLAGEIKDKYKFSIIYLTLTPQQYEQMSSMGLFPGKKDILYEK